jgi:hypothetical protein
VGHGSVKSVGGHLDLPAGGHEDLPAGGHDGSRRSLPEIAAAVRNGTSMMLGPG